MPETVKLTQLIVEFYEKLSSWEHCVVRDKGLTLPQVHALEILGSHKALRMKELAEKMGKTGKEIALNEFSAEIIIPQTDEHAPPATEIQPQQNDVPPPSAKSRKLKHWSGNPSAALEKQATEEEIYQEFIAIGQLLIETAENKELSTQDRFQIFSAQAYRQPLLIQHLKHLLAQQSIRPEGQC